MIQKPDIPDPGPSAGLHDDGLDIGALLPDTLAAWRPLLVEAIGFFLEHRAAALGLPAIDYRSHLASASRLLQQEIRLDREQANMRAASALLDADGAVFVPALLPWCTPEITAMARVEGPKLADAALRTGQGRRLGHALVAALLGRPFWSAADDALFHGDLHGGNLLLTPDGRIAALDWSLTASLSKPHREALVAIALAALALDEARVVAGLAALGLRDARGAAITARVGAALDALVRSGRPPGFDWLLRLLDELALQGAAGFGAQLAILRKSWLSLSGVLHDLGAGAQADLPLIDVGLQRFMGEWPARLVAAPDSRAFATHVSTADLIHTAVHAWPASLRYWTRLFARA